MPYATPNGVVFALGRTDPNPQIPLLKAKYAYNTTVNIYMPELQEKTVTPGAAAKEVTPDSGYNALGKVTVSGDANLVPENIADGVSIFGVNGTHKGGLEGWVSGETELISMKQQEPVAVDGFGFIIPELNDFPPQIFIDISSVSGEHIVSFLCMNKENLVYSDQSSFSTIISINSNNAYEVFFADVLNPGITLGCKAQYSYNTSMVNTLVKNPEVKSITATGSYTSSTYQQGYWAAITKDGHLIITVKGGTSTAYESIYFTNASLPNWVGFLGQSYYSYSSMTAGQMYVAIYEGVSRDVKITLNFNSTNSSSDYVQCAVTIAYS